MNRNDFKKLLKQLGNDLIKTIKNLKEESVQAKSLITRIKSYVKTAEIFVKKIESAQELESQISIIKTSADSHLTSITSSLGSIQAHVSEMETAYTKFVEINGKITNEESGLEKILADSESIKSDIDATKKTTETIFKEISKLKDTASAYTNDIKKLLQVAEKTVEKITKNHEESEDLKKRINDIFHISSQKVHANYFDERRKFLAKTSIAWFILFILMMILTIYLGDKYISPLVKLIDNSTGEIVKTITIEVILLKLSLISPAILTLFYCLTQFGHERRLHEQYAFKAVSMLSIESSVQLLIRALEKNQKPDIKDEQIISFAVKTLESIYKDPIESNKRSFLVKGGNPILELSAELKESIGEIKEDVNKLKKGNA